MTDKELLEDAAKAAGIDAPWNGVFFEIAVPFRGHLMMVMRCGLR